MQDSRSSPSVPCGRWVSPKNRRAEKLSQPLAGCTTQERRPWRVETFFFRATPLDIWCHSLRVKDQTDIDKIIKSFAISHAEVADSHRLEVRGSVQEVKGKACCSCKREFREPQKMWSERAKARVNWLWHKKCSCGMAEVPHFLFSSLIWLYLNNSELPRFLYIFKYISSGTFANWNIILYIL